MVDALLKTLRLTCLVSEIRSIAMLTMSARNKKTMLMPSVHALALSQAHYLKSMLMPLKRVLSSIKLLLPLTSSVEKMNERLELIFYCYAQESKIACF